MGPIEAGRAGSGVRIRAAEARDMPAIAAITNREIVGGVAHFGTEPEPPEAFEHLWREGLETTGFGRLPWVVAEAPDGSVAGYAKASRWKTRQAYRWTVELGIYIHADHRGRGVGRALYARLFEDLEAIGYRTLLAGITLPNDASVRLHESMGMTRCAVIPRNGYKHGAWHDVGYWVRTLGDAGEAPIGA